MTKSVQSSLSQPNSLSKLLRPAALSWNSAAALGVATPPLSIVHLSDTPSLRTSALPVGIFFLLETPESPHSYAATPLSSAGMHIWHSISAHVITSCLLGRKRLSVQKVWFEQIWIQMKTKKVFIHSGISVFLCCVHPVFILWQLCSATLVKKNKTKKTTSFGQTDILFVNPLLLRVSVHRDTHP